MTSLESKEKMLLKKLVGIKRQMAEQRLKTHVDAVATCQSRIQSVLTGLDQVSGHAGEFENLALAAINKSPERTRLKLLQLRQELARLETHVEQEQASLRKIFYSEMQL